MLLYLHLFIYFCFFLFVLQISPNDRLSLSICHACISYLNSWQSFKNRCLASQNKQRSWLESGHNNTKKSAYQQDQGDTHHDDQQAQDDMASVSGLAPSILEGITSLKKRKSLTVYVSPKQTQSPAPAPTTITTTTSTTTTTTTSIITTTTTTTSTKRPYKYKPRQSSQQQTQSSNVLLHSSKVKHKSSHKELLIPIQQTTPMQIFTSPVVAAAPTATITSAALALVPGNEATAPTNVATVVASATSCQNAVQQLRLFRRYSYNVNVSYVKTNMSIPLLF